MPLPVFPPRPRAFCTGGAGNRPPQISIEGQLAQQDLEVFTFFAEKARVDAASAAKGAQLVGRGSVSVALDSHGGNIWVAMSIGRLIRKYSFQTRVEVGASCVSACVYLLAAGSGRYVGGRVGIHRPYLPNDGVTSARAKRAQYAGINAQTRQYLEEMALPTSLHDRMMRTPPDRVALLSAQDVSKYGLTTLRVPSNAAPR